jgi:hypothetical protein
MLHSIDKDRLDEVLSILDNAKIRFPVADIVAKTGFTKGHVSNILKGNIPMSEKFYDTFLEKYHKTPISNTNYDENHKNINELNEPSAAYITGSDLHSLIDTNKGLAISNQALSIANQELATAHKNITITNLKLAEIMQDSNSKKVPVGQTLDVFLNQIAKGLVGKAWDDELQGLRILGTILSSNFVENMQLGTNNKTYR